MSGEGVGTLRAASEEYTRVIISRESRESHKILLYAFGGIGVICVSKKPRTLHADVPTLTAHQRAIVHIRKKQKSMALTMLLVGWAIRIRTRTNRTKTCCATITP